ncbi:UNVERIFIED_CONTAM: hypothetical protein MUK63_06695 [Blautia caecimuris]
MGKLKYSTFRLSNGKEMVLYSHNGNVHIMPYEDFYRMSYVLKKEMEESKKYDYRNVKADDKRFRTA